jgi:hypothetical protein
MKMNVATSSTQKASSAMVNENEELQQRGQGERQQ